MSTKRFSVSQDEDGIHHLKGELSVHDLDEIRSFLDHCLSRGKEKEIVMSLEKIRFMDTAALQLLIAFKKALAPGTRLRISHVSAEVEGILSFCGLKTALL